MKKFWKSFKIILLSLLVMALWGSLYPFVKIGYDAFSIDGSDIPSILMFAGTRFAFCGAVASLIALIRREKMQAPKSKSVCTILLVGFFSIVLHYAFYYIGIASTDVSKSAILKQLGALFYICVAFLFFKSESFSVWKIAGGVLGLAGIVAINFDSNGVSFSTGDILIILASICTVVASIFSKKIVAGTSPFWITGISQFVGGTVLILAALIMGAGMLNFSWYAFGVFVYICVASTTAYLLWNYILRTSELSIMFIIKFAEPLFACIFSAILLQEDIFQLQYLIAFVLISAGIVLGNKTKKNTMKAKIFEIKRFAVHDGDGIRTTVFFKGCPLKCVWCHNPEGISGETELAYFSHKCIGCGECVSVCLTGAHTIENETHRFHREKCVACGRCEEVCLGNALTLYGKEYTVEELLPILLKDKEFYDNSGGGITLSGGECLLYADFCAALLKRLKKKGVHTAVDTCGMASKTALDKVLPYTDVFLYDVKALSEIVHKNCTGHSNGQILENLLYLDEKGATVEIHIPFVPDYNDEEMEEIAQFLSRLKGAPKIRVLAYHNLAGSKYAGLDIENTLPRRLPTEEEINAVINKFKSYQLNV